MDLKELKGMSAQELDSKLIALLKEQFNLRMQKGSGQLSQSHLLKQTRRDIARVKTVLTQQAGDK